MQLTSTTLVVIMIHLFGYSMTAGSGEKKTETVQWSIGIPEPAKYDQHYMGSYGGHGHWDYGHSLPSGGYGSFGGGHDLGCFGGHGFLGIIIAVIGAVLLIPLLGSLFALKMQLLGPLFGQGVANPIVTANVGQKTLQSRVNDLLPIVDDALDKLARSLDRPVDVKTDRQHGGPQSSRQRAYPYNHHSNQQQMHHQQSSSSHIDSSTSSVISSSKKNP